VCKFKEWHAQRTWTSGCIYSVAMFRHFFGLNNLSSSSWMHICTVSNYLRTIFGCKDLLVCMFKEWQTRRTWTSGCIQSVAMFMHFLGLNNLSSSSWMHICTVCKYLWAIFGCSVLLLFSHLGHQYSYRDIRLKQAYKKGEDDRWRWPKLAPLGYYLHEYICIQVLYPETTMAINNTHLMFCILGAYTVQTDN